MRGRLGISLALSAALSAACDKHAAPGSSAASAVAAPAPSPTRTAPPAPAPSAITSARSEERNEAPSPRRDAGPEAAGPWIVDEVANIGPAGPASASTDGVVMITRDDKLVVARLDPKAMLHSAKPGATPIAPIGLEAGAFQPFARGPGVIAGSAYWISKGRLVRQPLDATGAPAVLADDARDGSRVAVAGGSGSPVTAAYIARGGPDGSGLAKLWTEGAGAINVSPDGTSPSTLALVADGDVRILLSLEGRTGMTPVHARRIELVGGKPKPADDVVAWVAGPAQALTQIGAVTADGDVWAFVPLERDITSFGLARVRIAGEPRMGAPVVWRAYANGLDPAPVAAGRVCGAAAVLYASPAEAKPHAAQELSLAALDGDALGPATVLARSGGFLDVSMTAIADGALIAWVADHRTWATIVRCRRRAN